MEPSSPRRVEGIIRLGLSDRLACLLCRLPVVGEKNGSASTCAAASFVEDESLRISLPLARLDQFRHVSVLYSALVSRIPFGFRC